MYSKFLFFKNLFLLYNHEKCFAVTNGSSSMPTDLQNHWHVSFPNMIRKFDVISSALGQTVDVLNIKYDMKYHLLKLR